MWAGLQAVITVTRGPCGSRRRPVAAMALSPVLGKLQHKRVILASASPRRREILSNAVSRAGQGAGRGRGHSDRDG